MFSVYFTKGNDFRDFLFASLADIALPNMGLLLKETLLLGKQMTPNEKGGKIKIKKGCYSRKCNHLP